MEMAEIKLECLRIASCHSPNADTLEVIAERLFKFVTGQVPIARKSPVDNPDKD